MLRPCQLRIQKFNRTYMKEGPSCDYHNSIVGLVLFRGNIALY